MGVKRHIIIYFVIIGSIGLMIYNISQLDFNDLPKGPLAGILSNVLMILAMLITIRALKKKE